MDPAFSRPVLRAGARGEAVWELQRLLASWLRASGATAEAEWFQRVCENARHRQGFAYFGHETSLMVVRFQAASHLRPDHIVGNETWSKLTGENPAAAPPAGRGPTAKPPQTDRSMGPASPVAPNGANAAAGAAEGVDPRVRAKYLSLVGRVTDNYPATGRRPHQRVEPWRALVAYYWPSTAVNDALRIIDYESKGIANKIGERVKSDVGLFQCNYTANGASFGIRNLAEWQRVMSNPDNNIMAALVIWKENRQRFYPRWTVTYEGLPGADIR